MSELEDKLYEKIVEKLESIKATEICVNIELNKSCVFIILTYCLANSYFEITFSIDKENLKNDVNYTNYVKYLGLNSVFIIEDYLNEKTP